MKKNNLRSSIKAILEAFTDNPLLLKGKLSEEDKKTFIALLTEHGIDKINFVKEVLLSPPNVIDKNYTFLWKITGELDYETVLSEEQEAKIDDNITFLEELNIKSIDNKKDN